MQVRKCHLNNYYPSLVLVISAFTRAIPNEEEERGRMNLLHQEEVDLLKTVILFPVSSPTLQSSRLERRGKLIFSMKWHSTLSKLTSHIVLQAGMFYGLLAHLGTRLSVCRVSGWAAGVGSLLGTANAGIPNRR